MSLKALREALDRAPGAETLQRPYSAGSASVPSLRAPKKKEDDGTALAHFAARQLSQLPHYVSNSYTKATGSLGEAARVNLANWTVDSVAEWLRAHARLEDELIDSICRQGINGKELITLDDMDLRALGMASLPERKRVLRLLEQLRLRSALPRARHGPLQQHLDVRRERLTGLCETFSRVLSHFPAMPIKSKRVLMTLWHENEAVGLEALGRIERDAALRRQAELDLTERFRQQARNLIEAQIVLRAQVEDREVALELRLHNEQSTVASLREVLEPRLLEFGAPKEDGRLHRHLQAADFRAAEVPADLGETLMRVGGDIESLFSAVEAEGDARDAALMEAGVVAKELEDATAQVAAKKAEAAVAVKKAQMAVKQAHAVVSAPPAATIKVSEGAAHDATFVAQPEHLFRVREFVE